jgi:predicted alpha/beta superfamily hydrolase
MKKSLINLLTSLFICFSIILNGQLTIIVDQLPSNTPDSAVLFVAGDFNGWNPGNPDFSLALNDNGQHDITIQLPQGNIQFKFTRGSWDEVEGNETGGFRPNRTYSYSGTVDTLYCQILGWEDLSGNQSTASENVHIMDDDFYLEFINRERRIWIYLPPDYETSQKSYKVLYMQDGQNLFDVSTSFAGEWEVDETLNRLFDEGDEGCIVVGIDNGGEYRVDEYTPWGNILYGGGAGEEYLISILNSLKPYVDQNYRTKPGRNHTGIMGSSLGGLISMYGGLKYDSIFSRIGSFSTSYWFAKEEAIAFVQDDPHQVPMRIYSIAGASENGNIPEDAIALDSLLHQLGYTSEEIQTTIHQDGQHSEWYWAREFESAYQWLWDELSPVKQEPALHNVQIYPNPGKDILNIEYIGNLKVESVHILDINSRLLKRYSGLESQISIIDLPGQLIVLIQFENGDEVVKKVVHSSQ